MHDDDIRGELFSKLGAESSGNPEEMLSKAVVEFKDGDPIEAKKIFKEIISITTTNALRYETQSQHRAAAQEYYIQAVSYEYMQQTSDRDKNYAKVIDGLLSYAKTALTFEENEKGITSASLAGLVCIISGNNNRAFEIYNKHMEILKSKNNSQGLMQIIYSLGYLLDALKNTNVAALSDAQNFISKDLKPMLSTAKLTGFNNLLKSVVIFTQNVIESRIKMPKILVDTSIPRDILFNDIFEFVLTVENAGEGLATEIKVSLQFPEDIEILSGEKSISYDKLDSNDKKIITYSLRYQTASDINEITKEIKGNLTYVDMLNNGHKQYIGPLNFEIRSMSKTSEYIEKLNKVKEDYNSLNFENLSPILNLLVPAMRNEFDLFVQKLQEEIEKQEFDNADFGFKIVSSLVDVQKSILLEGEISKSIVENVNKQIETAVNSKAEELTAKHTKDKEDAIAKIVLEKNNEKANELDKLKAEMKELHEKQINELKEQNFKELGKINQAHENKLNKHLADLEQSLEAKFVQESNTKSDEFEKTMNELRTHHENELDEIRSKLKKELKDKYTREIDEIRESKDEEIRKINEANEENLENSLNAQKIKLEGIKNEEIEAVKRELRTELAREHEGEIDKLKSKYTSEIDTKNKMIDELERQIRDLKSSSH